MMRAGIPTVEKETRLCSSLSTPSGAKRLVNFESIGIYIGNDSSRILSCTRHDNSGQLEKVDDDKCLECETIQAQ